MRRLHLVDPAVDDLPVLLTVAEAATVLRISRSLAYDLARRYLDSGGVEGLPVITLGTRRRVPRAALLELARTGHVVQLGAAAGGRPPSRPSRLRDAMPTVAAPDVSALQGRSAGRRGWRSR